MKIAITRPPFYKIINADFAGGFGLEGHKTKSNMPTLDMGYAASLLQNDHSVRIIDAPAEDIKKEKFLDIILNANIDILCVRTTLVSLQSDIDICKKLKTIQPKIKIIFFGTICKFIDPKRFQGAADYVISNKIGNFITKIVEELKNKKTFNVITHPDKVVDYNIDEFPYPAHELYPLNKYSRDDLKTPFFPLIASSGCPYTCPYCPYISIDKKWRPRTIDNIIAELKNLTHHKINRIVFRDPVFTFDKKRIVELCNKMIELNLNIEWICETRADLIDESLLSKMREAGCKEVIMGIESGNEKILKNIAKVELSKQSILNAVKSLKNVGLLTRGLFMIGFPDDDKNTIKETIEFAKTLDLNYANFFIFTPYPGTPIRKIMEKEGLIISNDFSLYTGFNAVIRTKHVSSDELNHFCEYANSIW